MARIVLNTFGSFGDLHPFLAIALELKRRGHESVIATSEIYRAKIEAEGIPFAPVRPNAGEFLHNEAMLRKVWHPRRGTEHLMRDFLAPRIEESYADLLAASYGADLLLTSTAALAGPIVAEKNSIPWLSVVLQPSMFLSTYDPPFAPSAVMRRLFGLGRWARAGLFAFARAVVKGWLRPVLELRRRLGLPTKACPLLEGALSPYGTLALFSQVFAEPQPDWPSRVTTTGFVFYDKSGPMFENAARPCLAEFLAWGSSPIVFTLGSSAVMQAGDFYGESLAAVRQLGLRAVLLTGLVENREFEKAPADSVLITPYAPYSELFPRAAAIVHQGGIGTTAQALRAGKPMLVVPWSHDQPDNAERLRKLGVSETLSRSRYSSVTAANAIKSLLGHERYSQAAASVSKHVSAEDGLAVACDVIERTLAGISTPNTINSP